MTIDRHQLFTLAWGQARKLAAKSGTARTHIGMSLRICWAILKEAARKAALPARCNAYAMGAPAFIHADQPSGPTAPAPCPSGPADTAPR